jgi:hypothetical protein
LEACDLTKRVGSGPAARRLFDGVGLTARAGEVVAVAWVSREAIRESVVEGLAARAS